MFRQGSFGQYVFNRQHQHNTPEQSNPVQQTDLSNQGEEYWHESEKQDTSQSHETIPYPENYQTQIEGIPQWRGGSINSASHKNLPQSAYPQKQFSQSQWASYRHPATINTASQDPKNPSLEPNTPQCNINGAIPLQYYPGRSYSVAFQQYPPQAHPQVLGGAPRYFPPTEARLQVPCQKSFINNEAVLARQEVSLRALSMGNIYAVPQAKATPNQACAVCMEPFSLLDEFEFTYHPGIKTYCQTHKKCFKHLRRDSILVAVPKFEIKAGVESQETSELAYKKPRSIVLNFEILHPVSKFVIFARNELLMTSTVMLQSEGQTDCKVPQISSQCETTFCRHLYFNKFDDTISLPFNMILIKLIWKRVEATYQLGEHKSPITPISKVATGLLDLNDVIAQTSGGLTQDAQKSLSTQLEADQDSIVELDFKVSSKRAADGVTDYFLISELSFVLEAKDFSDATTASSTLAQPVSRHYSVDFAAGPLQPFSLQPRQFSNSGHEPIRFPGGVGIQQDFGNMEHSIQFQRKKAHSIFASQAHMDQLSPFNPLKVTQQEGLLLDPRLAYQARNHSITSSSFGGLNPAFEVIPSTQAKATDQTQPQGSACQAQTQPLPKEGEVVEKILTKQGSRELQKAIERAHPIFINQVVQEIEPQLVRVLVDQYGNYFCQKLFPKMTSEQQMTILSGLFQIHITEEQKREKTSKKRLISKLLFVSQDNRGTHAIQSLIDAIADKAELISAVASHINEDLLKYALNKHATHVLIKFMKAVDVHPYLDEIYAAIVESWQKLSTDPNGLPVIKTSIQKFNIDEMKLHMVNKMVEHVVSLSQNAYGNYALQVALEYWSNEDCQGIYQGLLPQLQQLSVQKFSSNVIEKLLDKADQYHVELYAEELCNVNRLRILVRVNYGYYVVERVLLRCKNERVKAKLRDEVIKNLNYVGQGNLKNKWVDLLEKSRLGLLQQASNQDQDMESTTPYQGQAFQVPPFKY